MQQRVTLEEVFQAFNGSTPEEAHAFIEQYQRRELNRRRCPGHTFIKDARGHETCSLCNWQPSKAQLLAYAQGLRHGRALATQRRPITKTEITKP